MSKHFHLILIATVSSKYHFSPQFTDQETEAHRLFQGHTQVVCLALDLMCFIHCTRHQQTFSMKGQRVKYLRIF